MKSRAREQASSSIPLRGRHERGAEKNGKQMRSQGASRSENHDGKQQDMTTHEQNAKSDRQTRPEPAHNSHKSKTNDTPRPPRVRPRGQERERKKWSIWYYVVQFSSWLRSRAPFLVVRRQRTLPTCAEELPDPPHLDPCLKGAQGQKSAAPVGRSRAESAR